MRTVFNIYNKVLLAVIVSVMLSTAPTQAQDMKDLFTAMPDSIIPQLEEAWRKDLIDLLQSGKEARLKNTLEGSSELQALTEDYLRLKPTERSIMELKRLPLINNTYIICMITTVEGTAPDSRIQFFTTGWQPLNGVGEMQPLSVSDFLSTDTDTANNEYKYAVSRLDMDLIKYSLNPGNTTLTASYMTPLYLSKQEREQVFKFLKPKPIIYNWNRTAFVRE
jgi:hypothetical protein